MPRGPVVSISFTAGTAGMVADVRKATASVREFGTVAKGSSLQANAAIRALEGNFQSNTRAVSLFLRETLHLGPALTAAFSVVGPVLFAKVLFDVGKKIYEFFKDLRNAPLKASAAFREMNDSIRVTNLQLDITNSRLREELAKLEGKRENGAATALLEIKLAAEQLADSLDKDIKKLNEVLKEQNISTFAGQVLRKGTTTYIKEYFGGETGTGGFANRIAQIKQAAGGDAEAYTAALTKALAEAQDTIAGWWVNLYKSREKAIAGGITAADFSRIHAVEIEELTAAENYIASLSGEVDKTSEKAKLSGAVDKAKAAKGTAQLGLPEDIEIKKLKAELAGLDKELSAIGKDDQFKEMAKAALLVDEAIAKINAQLEEKYPGAGKTASTAGIAEINALITRKVQDQAKIETGTKIDEHIKKLSEEAAGYRDVAAAIGLAYEATRKASIAAALAKNPEYAKGTTEQKIAMELAEAEKLDDEHAAAVKDSINGLQQETALALKLAAAQSLGAEAVRRAALDEQERLVRLKDGDAAAGVIEEMERKNFADRANANAAEIADIDLKIAAERRLMAASGEQARLEAEIANKQAAAAKQYGAGSPVVGAIGVLAGIEERAKLMKEVDALVNDYANKINDIKLKEAAIDLYYEQDLNTLIAARELQDELLKTEAQYVLQQRTLSAGVHAFFLDMQADAESAAQIVYNSLHDALDRISSEFGKLLTGQIKRQDLRKDIGKMFQDVGGSMVSSSIKSLAQTGLGALGAKIGGPLGDAISTASKGKADGSAANPFYVIMKGGNLPQPPDIGPQTAIPGGGGVGGILGTLFGGGPAGAAGGSAAAGGGGVGGILGTLFGGGPAGAAGGSAAAGGGGFDFAAAADSFGGFLAGGGDTVSGMPYIVGENGPEIRQFTAASGSVVPMSMGRGGDTYQIDARGADLGAANRISRAIEFAQRSAVTDSARVQHERSMRVPQHTRR